MWEKLQSTQSQIQFYNCLTQSALSLGTANLKPATNSQRDVEKELLVDFIYYFTLNRNLLWLLPSVLSWYLVVVVVRSE